MKNRTEQGAEMTLEKTQYRAEKIWQLKYEYVSCVKSKGMLLPIFHEMITFTLQSKDKYRWIN